MVVQRAHCEMPCKYYKNGLNWIYFWQMYFLDCFPTFQCSLLDFLGLNANNCFTYTNISEYIKSAKKISITHPETTSQVLVLRLGVSKYTRTRKITVSGLCNSGFGYIYKRLHNQSSSQLFCLNFVCIFLHLLRFGVKKVVCLLDFLMCCWCGIKAIVER